jgi:hypothetical protein
MSTTYSGGTGTVSDLASASYPISISVPRQPSYSRFFAIPLIGYLARGILLIPHLFALYFVGIVNSIIHYGAWFPVISNGQYPDWAYNWTSGYLRWGVRIMAYFYGLTDQYPPFAINSENDGYPIQVAFQVPQNPGKFFAIPVVGIFARIILLIPHMIALYVLFLVNALIHLAAWFPVISSGQYPDWAYNWTTGTMRWYVRLGAYFFGFSDAYPPFSMSE